MRDREWNTGSDTVVINVEDLEDPVANAGLDQTVDLETVVTFNGSASTDNIGVVNWTWVFDDEGAQTLYEVAPTYAFNHAGTFTVTLTVKDAADHSATDTVVITVNDTAPPTAVAGPDQSVLPGTTVTFDGSGSYDNVGITSYTWNFTDGTAKILTGIHPTYIFNNEGVFVVTMNVTDAAGNWALDTVTITVEVPDTEDPVANAGPDQTVDEGATVTFDGSASDDNVGIATYTWTFTDGSAKIRTGQKPTYEFNNEGVFVVTLNVTDAAGNYDTDTVTITVEAVDTVKPVAKAGPDQTVDVGDVVSFDGSDSTDNVEVVNYTWTLTYDDELKTLYGAEPTMEFEIADEYTVTLTVKDAAGNSHTDTVKITVEESGGGISTMAIVGIGAVAVIAVAAAALLLMRKKGAGSPPVG